MRTESNLEVDRWEKPEVRRFDLLMIASSGVIAVSAIFIAMTVSVMVS